MLQSIRDRTQGWIAGIIISILILSFALWGIHSYLVSAGVNPNVAKVNGVEITKTQLSIAYDRLRRQQQSQYANDALLANTETNLKERALQSLINVTVLQQASLKEGYRISDRQTQGFLLGMPEFQVNGQFSESRFQQILSVSLLSMNDFLQLIKTSLLIDQPRLGMIFTSFALPNEVLDSSGLIAQERELFYLMVPLHYFDKEPLTISDSQIEAYYKAHTADFKTEEQVNALYIELTLPDVMSKITPKDEELINFYNDNPTAFEKPAQWRLEGLILPIPSHASPQDIQQAETTMNEVYKKAQHGTMDLTQLSKEYHLTKYNNYLQNAATLNQFPPDSQKDIASLTQPGHVTRPIKVKEGYAIFQVKTYEEPKVLPFDNVKTAVNDAYVRQKAEEQFANLRETLANLTYEHPESLALAAKELGLTIQETGLFSKDARKSSAIPEKIRDAAFSDEVLRLQNNSDVIQKSPEVIDVIRLKSHVPAAVLPLKRVKNQIIEKLQASQINEKLSKFANEIEQQLQKNTMPVSQIVKQYHLTLTELGFIGRYSTKADAAMLDTAFAMPKPMASKISYAVAKVPEGYAVIGLKSTRKGTLKNADQYRVFAEQIQNTQGLQEYELYKENLMAKAKIKIYS